MTEALATVALWALRVIGGIVMLGAVVLLCLYVATGAVSVGIEGRK